MPINLLVALAFAYTQSYGLRTINAVLAPTLRQTFELTNGQLGLLTSAYFIAFCAMQIPLGPLLDKYGTRRVESVLLLIAASGALTFGLSEGFYGLLIGRMLIGFGVSACLMGAFKSFREQFALAQQGRLSIFMLFFGSTGALLATQPTQWMMESVGWRSIFFGMAVALALAAGLIWRWVPDALPAPSTNAQAAPPSYRAVMASALFWQSVPIYLVMVGGYLALQSLWCGPWLMEVAQKSAHQSAQVLLSMALTQLVSFIIIGVWVAPWASKHHKDMLVVRIAFFCAVVSLLLATSNPVAWGQWGLMGFAFFFSTNTLSQTLVNATFPSHLVGRSSTAGNFLIFVGAFIFQWSIGLFIDGLMAYGFNRAGALNLSLIVMAGLMAIAWLWYVFSPRKFAPMLAERFKA